MDIQGISCLVRADVFSSSVLPYLKRISDRVIHEDGDYDQIRKLKGQGVAYVMSWYKGKGEVPPDAKVNIIIENPSNSVKNKLERLVVKNA